MMADNGVYEAHNDLLEAIILDNPAKGIQYRLTISEFYDKKYLGIREWYQDFEGVFQASKNGVTMPYNLHTSARMYQALVSVLSQAEVLNEVIQEAENVEAKNTRSDEDVE